MTVLFGLFLLAHGLIHLLGFAKAYELADLPQLTRPVSPFYGFMWLIAALLFTAAAGSLFVWPRWWWAIGACAIVVSTLAIVPSWADARFGALANVVAAVGVAFGFLALGPGSLRAAYDNDTDQALARFDPLPAIADADLATLPDPVHRYLRASGVVGRPRVRNFRVRMHGRIRNGSDARWIPIVTEQYNFVDRPARFFYLTGSLFLIPVQGYHRYAGSSAMMRVKAAALVPVAVASGDEMTQAETVTLFNDMCVMAPATLIEPTIAWEPVDARTVRASFTNAGHTIRATLAFNEAGELTDFWSDDRYQTTPDGRSRKIRWSTPVRAYRSFGDVRLSSGGEGRWHEPGGEYAYIELTLDDVQYNVRSR
jgi:hypothetical protein